MNSAIISNGIVAYAAKVSIRGKEIPIKWLIIMKLLVLYILVLCSCSFGELHAQKVSIDVKSASFKEVVRIIKKQSGYSIVINNRQLEAAKPVTLKINTDDLDQVLDELFKNQPFGYKRKGKIITITEKSISTVGKIEVPINLPSLQDHIRGRVVDSLGNPIQRASIKVKGEKKVFLTDDNGYFNLAPQFDNSTIVIESLGFQSFATTAKNGIEIALKRNESIIDEAIVMGYGTTSRRFNTGSIERISSKDIESQPVNNLLSALSGRLPGVIINQSTGVPGGKVNIEIQGRNNISSSSIAEPLVIIDGVPFAAQNDKTNRLGSTDLSPLSLINPNDISSIEVLKDADATAIYGSRGAYGVILITTKKGSVGKTRVTASQSFNVNSITRKIDLLNTEEYLNMRKEAFSNDMVTPDISNAPDLLSWDQNSYTDWQKELIGNNAYSRNSQLSISGGNQNTRFLLSAGYLNEDLVFKYTKPYSRFSSHMNLDHTSDNGKFNMTFSAGYNTSINNTSISDLTNLTILLPPNYPNTLDGNGNLIWEFDGTPLYYGNPFDYTKSKFKVATKGLSSNLVLNYKFLETFTARISGGYNIMDTYSEYLLPISAADPHYEQTGSMATGNNMFDSWIIEPQLEYNNSFSSSKLNILLGSSFQQTKNDIKDITARGFTSDDLLGSLSAASIYTANSYNSDYRYSALFGRINYNIANRYIINLSGRRDGSSRFSKGHRFGNFGAVGLGWIFSEEKWVKEELPVLSFGKLRASYGITGSDKIGDYKYLDSWRSVINPYLDIKGVYPVRLANEEYIWETNKKLSIGVELGFLKDRILLNSGYYNNRGGNQLINTPLPLITGFSSIIENFPATIENKGWEFSIRTENLKNDNFRWNTNFNITLPKNRLLRFPGIETSNYAKDYIVGKSLNLILAYSSDGVDPEKGIFLFKDQNNDGIVDFNDRQYIGTTDPKYYGGVQNNFSYKGISLDIFFEYRKQKGLNFLKSIYQGSGTVPGFMENMPVFVLDRWQFPGDVTAYQKFSANNGKEASNASKFLANDVDIKYSDASFLRLKSAAINYSLSSDLLEKLKLQAVTFSLRAQNLFTITKYKGSDPEIRDLRVLPPMRTLGFGLELTF